jgi:hypothetical protein
VRRLLLALARPVAKSTASGCIGLIGDEDSKPPPAVATTDDNNGSSTDEMRL